MTIIAKLEDGIPNQLGNGYFNPPEPLAPATKARAGDINAITTATNGAFDKLPAEEPLKRDTLNYVLTQGAPVAYTATLPYAPGSYVDGMHLALRIHTGNTGAPTINCNGLGPKPIKKPDGSAPIAGELLGIVELRYNVALGHFQTLSALAPASSVPITSGTLDLFEGAVIASTAILDLDAATGNTVHITGTTTINTILLTGGRERTLIFDGTLNIIHGEALKCPSSIDLATAPGDIARVVSSAGVVYLYNYIRASGRANAAAPFANAADIKAGTATNAVISPAELKAATGVSSYVQTSDQTVTSGGTLTIAHGLGRIPVMLQGFVRGIAGGAVAPLAPGSHINPTLSTLHGYGMYADATNIYVAFASPVDYALRGYAGGGTYEYDLANSTIKFFVRAWA